jgi:hypothetical protein
MESTIIAITAIIASLGAVVKQVYDTNQFKKWVCFKNPCPNRLNNEAQTKTETVESKYSQ